MEIEIWRKIESTKYLVSNAGRVRSANCILKPRPTQQNYMRVQIHGSEKYIHRLVFGAFIKAIPDKLQINHLNSDPTDNRLCNLELTTPSQNKQHALHQQWYFTQIRLPGFDWYLSSTGHLPIYCTKGINL